MSSTFMPINYNYNNYKMATTATTMMSTYGLNYFNDSSSSSECSDGYQSSISPINSPALAPFNYIAENYNYNSNGVSNVRNVPYSPSRLEQQNYQNDCCYYPQTANLNSYEFKESPHLKDCSKIKSCIATGSNKISKSLTAHKVARTNRFVEQFKQKHESLNQKIMDRQSPSISAASNSFAPPEILKKRRVAANARERRRMNNLNFAFDRYVEIFSDFQLEFNYFI